MHGSHGAIIYLDQNAASYLADPLRIPGWDAIRQTLQELRRLNLATCPMPSETIIESAPCPQSLRLAIENLFENLSGGIAFQTLPELIIQSTLSLVRPQIIPMRFKPLPAGWSRSNAEAIQLAATHREYNERMSENMSKFKASYNSLTIRPQGMFVHNLRQRSKMLFRDLKLYQVDPTTHASEYETGWLMEVLLQHCLTRCEAETLQNRIINQDWDRACPANIIDCYLGAHWDHDINSGQRPNYLPNDESDRRRASVALAHADVFVTDKYLADLCRRANTEQYTSTKVFSVKQSREIAHYLASLM